MQSAERVSHRDASDNYVFQRSILAYHKAAGIVSGRVLEIGTGSGYGVEIVAPRAERFVTIDKTTPDHSVIDDIPNVVFHRQAVPPLRDIASDSFDYVITFQVIEHIRRDSATIAEIYRVLKKGGKLLISTPNKAMSLTRNPWHVREYTPAQLEDLLARHFGGSIEKLGVFGNRKVMEYYEKNRASVHAVMKYDILRLQYILPRWLLKIPYDIMNRRNRRKLLNDNQALTSSIKMEDYHFGPVGKECFDLYYIARK